MELFYTKLHFQVFRDTRHPGIVSFHCSNMSSDITTGESDDYLLHHTVINAMRSFYTFTYIVLFVQGYLLVHFS